MKNIIKTQNYAQMYIIKTDRQTVQTIIKLCCLHELTIRSIINYKIPDM